MLGRSKKLFVSLSCAVLLITGCAVPALAGTSATHKMVALPALRNQTNVVTGTHTGATTEVCFIANSGATHSIYCNVVWGRTNVTGTFIVNAGQTIYAKNSAPQNSTVVLSIGNNEVSLYPDSAIINYDL